MNKLFYLSLLIIIFITPKSYAVNLCPSGGFSTADSGIIYDSGGASGTYSNNDDCRFLIQPSSSPAEITLTFSEFDLQNGYDELFIDNGTFTTIGSVSANYTGSSIPNSFTSTTGSIYLRFISDGSVTRPGFKVSWTSVTPEPELIASFNFDDDWVINNSLTDQTGSYNGSPGGSVSRVLASASGSKGDTCYAGSFAGGNIDITGLPVSTATGAKTSVSFWMNWDGTNNIMPMGWNKHDLWLVSGYFGFNTWSNDVTGISSSGLAYGWHHVVAVFTNGSVSNNKLYIDGVLKTISSKVGSIYTGNAIVQSALRIGGVLTDSYYNFRGMVDNFKIYTGEISQAQVTTDMNESNACAARANWHMDEASWNGTSNEVEDSSSNNYSGTSTGASTVQTTPAIVGNPGTCGYGKFNGINQKVTVPYSASLNPDSFTVSFWAKVEGNSGTYRSPITSRRAGAATPLGFNVYAANNNRWEFWTGSRYAGWDILRGANVVNNRWTHVAVSFTKYSTQNGNIHQGAKRLFINGQLSAIGWNRRYQPNSIEPLFIGAGSFGTYDLFNGSIDEMQLFDSALSQSQIQTIMAETHPCSNGGGGDTPATDFNCVNKETNGISGKLYTKTTGQQFRFDIIALQDASTIETSFASGADHTLTIEMVNAETAASCDSYPALTPAISQPLNMTAADTGTKTSAYMSSAIAYRNLKCRVTDTTASRSIVGCSTDSFAIRPTGMTLSSNLTNTSSTGTPTAKTGENFTLTATATAGYNGTPSINNSNIQAHVGAIQTGSISGSFIAANSATGIATGNTFSYSEVGSLRFSAQGVTIIVLRLLINQMIVQMIIPTPMFLEK